MRHSANGRRAITAARRGQVVQRIIVDRWTTERAAAAFDMPQRLVEIWVADYRRRGMASLRRVPPRTVLAEILEFWLRQPLAARLGRLFYHGHRRVPSPQPIQTALRGPHEESRGGSP